MDKREFFERIKGQMIVSCQAVPGEPLYVEEKSVMYLMARAAKMAGTPAIRTGSVRDVVAIKEETGLPVIGLIKIQYPGFESYITPTMKEVDELCEAGSDVIALDCTFSRRRDGRDVSDFIREVREKYPNQILMADISTYEERLSLFSQVLEAFRGRAMLVLDRCWDFWDEVDAAVKKAGMERQLILKFYTGDEKSWEWAAGHREYLVFPMMRKAEDLGEILSFLG